MSICILSARCRLFSNFMQIMAAKGCHLQYVCTYCQFVTCANFELSSNAEPYNEKSWDFYITIWGTFRYLSRFFDGLAHPNLHCKYIQCNFYTFYVCPIFQCNSTVQFTFNYCTKYSGKM